MTLYIRSHAIGSAAVVLLLFAPDPCGAANRHWLPPIQVSHTDTCGVPWAFAIGNADPTKLHAVITSQSETAECNLNNGLQDYLTWDRTAASLQDACSDAWGERERFNWDNPARDNWMSTDPHMVIDANDDVHCIWEEHQYLPSLATGYRMRGTGWAGVPPLSASEQPFIVNYVDDVFRSGGGPALFVEEAGSPGISGDVLHARWAGWHKSRPLDGSGGWSDGALLTTERFAGEGGLGAALVVTAGGVVHLIGHTTDATMRYVRHVSLTWSDSLQAWGGSSPDTLDAFAIPGPGGEEEDGVSTASVAVQLAKSLGGGETIHVAYNRGYGDDREIRYRRYQASGSTGSWYPPLSASSLSVTAADGRESTGAHLVREGNGKLHAVYRDGEGRAWREYFLYPDTTQNYWCVQGTTDPEDFAETIWRNELRYVSSSDSTTWSQPQPFTADMRTAFAVPKIVAVQDTAFVLFMAHDDDDLALSGQWYDGNWETWFRVGVPMPQTTIASGESLHWNGEIYLDRDFVVQAGGRLIIDAGTAVVAASLADSANAGGSGGTPGRVEILVEGQLEVRGTEDRPVQFRSVEQAEGDWGGVIFLDGAAAGSYLDHTSLRDATDGIRVAAAEAPALRGVTFARNQNADILLARDVRILAGTEWLLTPGTVVAAADPPGGEDAGGTSGACDLIVAGDLRAEGSVSELVVFTVEGGSGEWGGLVFDQAAVLSDLGQWSGEYTTHSLLQNVRIESAVSGVRVVNTGAPALQAVEFQSIAGDQHIVLDGSDVYVPFDGGWTLGRGTRVKARPHQSGKPEIGGRNPGLVDLVVHGPLVTLGIQGDSVHFEPDGATPTSMALGQAWGGVFVDWMSTGGSIEYTDIGYAPVPLALFLQNSTVRNSRLHHFRDQGLQVLGSWTLNGGPQVLDNLIERGAGLDGSVGRDGIYVMQVSAANINGNTVVIDSDADAADGGAGIRITAGHTYCGAVSGAYTLYVGENTVIGPGGDYVASNLGRWSGIYGDWMCGSDTRDIFVRDNLIEGWNGAGITLLQTKDVQFTCNEVRDCFDGVDFSRNTDVTGPPARFRGNVLKVGAYGGLNPDQDVARTDNAPKLALGPGTSDKGSNQLVADGADWFIRENDDTTAALNAASSYWKRNGVHYVQADTATIRTFFTTDLADPVIVDVSNALEILPDLCGASAMQAPRGDLADTDRPEDAPPTEAPHASDLPDRTDLTIVRPTGREVEIRFALSGREERAVVVEVFNVAGRRVETVLSRRLGGGRYGVSWSGIARDGSRVGTGVYLIRMRAGDETRVRKAVLVR